MEFSRTKPKELTPKDALKEKFATDLQMYIDVPTEQIEIEEFQELAVERVKLLRVLETVGAKNVKDMSFKDMVLDEMGKQNVKFFVPLVKGYADAESRRKDYLSHFILRLAYCRSEEYRRWFLARELEFFRLKFYNLERKEDVMLFMNKNNLKYAPIMDEEKLSISTELLNSTHKNISLEASNIYKVKFTQVLDLVKARKVFVKAGFAYVPHQDLISILTSIYRARLSYALSICCANLSSLESDERLSSILKGLHTSYTGHDYTVKAKDSIPITALDALSTKSYPLCMRQMHETFTKTHHLRYTARLQYNLFLKGIGVSMEDSLKFWRDGFTKKADIDLDKFEKQYSYGVRHGYGAEGRRANYTPHNCMKIITGNVAPGENHGCPFRHFDANHLRQKLLGYNVSMADMTDILDFVSRSHYQLACTRYFEVSHNIRNAKGVNHPNGYFEESQNIINGKKTGSNDSPKEKKPKVIDEWGNDSELDLDITAIISGSDTNN